MVNPWSLAIALIKSISIPVNLPLSFWKTNGAKKMSHLKLHILTFFRRCFFCPAGVVVVGTALLAVDWLSPVHFLMISSSVPSAFIWARALLNSVINFSWFPPFFNTKGKSHRLLPRPYWSLGPDPFGWHIEWRVDHPWLHPLHQLINCCTWDHPVSKVLIL